MSGVERETTIRRSRGVGLAEALVAITILALAGTVALVLFNGARKSFKLGDNLTEQQQVVRIAFDQMSRELRQAGTNINPGGYRNRPDEQIELAGETAIVFRADFDSGDAVLSVRPEKDLAMPAVGARFPTVSTGNDEIVGYALGKPDSGETWTFEADVLPPVRDGIVETVDLAGLARTQDEPPYTLYRVSLDESGSGVRTPVIDNVRFLRFVYYDGAGNVIGPPGGLDDPAGLGRNARAAIRRIGIEIEGLTRDALVGWNDPVDPVPGPAGRGQYRRFSLSGDVTPRNLGLVTMPDLDASFSPPSTPPSPLLYPGHCQALLVEWAPSPPQDEVARYELRFGTDPDDLAGPFYSYDPVYYLESLTEGETYHVTIQAVDDSGNVSNPSEPSTATVRNVNVPERVTGLVATSGPRALENEILFTWTAVTENCADPALAKPTRDPVWPALRDFGAFRIFRSVRPAIDTRVISNLLAMQTPVVYHDREVVNCRRYYYRVAATDLCAKEQLPDLEVSGASNYSIPPAAPINVRADWAGLPWSSKIEIRWDRVVHDLDGNEIYIENYKVQKAEEPPPLSFTTVALIDQGETFWSDPTPYSGSGNAAHYRVLAHDDCVNESDPSETTSPTCSFDGALQITEPPAYHQIGVGDEWLFIAVRVTGGSAPYDDLELEIVDGSNGNRVLTQNWATIPPWSYAWNVKTLPSGSYRIDVSVEQSSNNCVDSTSRFVTKH